jgi:hypothetical protein
LIDFKHFYPDIPYWLIPPLFFAMFFSAVWTGVILGDTLFIICCYGLDAYRNGLRFTNSKLGILSDGTELPIHIDVPRALFDALLVLAFFLMGMWIINRIFTLLRRDSDRA